jgi:DNA-binding transcriptional MerR regulator
MPPPCPRGRDGRLEWWGWRRGVTLCPVQGSRDDEPEALGAPLPVAAVARRLGVAPATLRTWDRRYGLGPSAHAPGAHRRYSPQDVARLQAMRRLTLEGVPPADAARVALAAEPAREPAARERPRGAGGRVLPLPGADAAARGLSRAAMALDATAVTAIVREEVARRGVVAAWEEVLRPVLVAVGERWAVTGEGVEVEHLLSGCVTAGLRAAADSPTTAPPGSPAPRPVLLACAPDDLHALPLHALAAALAERGTPTRTLGAALPADALAAAVRRTGPSLLLLWSQLPATADLSVLSGLPRTRPPTALAVGGPGWAGVELPAGVARAEGLKHAVSLVEQAQVTGSAGPNR